MIQQRPGKVVDPHKPGQSPGRPTAASGRDDPERILGRIRVRDAPGRQKSPKRHIQEGEGGPKQESQAILGAGAAAGSASPWKVWFRLQPPPLPPPLPSKGGWKAPRPCQASHCEEETGRPPGWLPGPPANRPLLSFQPRRSLTGEEPALGSCRTAPGQGCSRRRLPRPGACIPRRRMLGLVLRLQGGRTRPAARQLGNCSSPSGAGTRAVAQGGISVGAASGTGSPPGGLAPVWGDSRKWGALQKLEWGRSLHFRSRRVRFKGLPLSFLC